MPSSDESACVPHQASQLSDTASSRGPPRSRQLHRLFFGGGDLHLRGGYLDLVRTFISNVLRAGRREPGRGVRQLLEDRRAGLLLLHHDHKADAEVACDHNADSDHNPDCDNNANCDIEAVCDQFADAPIQQQCVSDCLLGARPPLSHHRLPVKEPLRSPDLLLPTLVAF